MAAVAALLAVAVTLARPALMQEGAPRVHVRWADGTTEAQRVAFEAELRLEPVEHKEDQTWRYELTDVSRRAIEAVVRHPAVADTHYIDRAAFEVAPGTPRGERSVGAIGRHAPALAGWLREHGTWTFALVAVVAGFLAVRPEPAHRVAAFLVRGVPELSLRTLAMFRVVLGLALAFFIYSYPYPQTPFPRDQHRTNVPLVQTEPVRWLAERPQLVHVVELAALGGALTFAAGILPRLSFVVAGGGFIVVIFALTLRLSSHPYGVLLLPLVLLMLVPWGDAPARPWLARAVSSRRYGYGPWVLCLALATAFAAAAWSKLVTPGWIENGSVRYAWVVDAENAPVDWGLTLAAMPRMSVFLSAAAVAIESMVIVAVFTRSALLRLALGCAAVSLLVGFYLFQGVLWPAWWLLLLGFLPWQWLDRSPAGDATAAAAPTRWQVALAAALIVQQVVVSANSLELEPLSSRYDMYSATSRSTDEFDQKNPDRRRRVLAVTADRVEHDVTDCLLRRPGWSRERLQAIDAATPASSLPGDCVRSSSPLLYYRVVEDYQAFDWSNGRFYFRYRDRPVATLAASQ